MFARKHSKGNRSPGLIVFVKDLKDVSRDFRVITVTNLQESRLPRQSRLPEFPGVVWPTYRFLRCC